jgi:hypothetical protein
VYGSPEEVALKTYRWTFKKASEERKKITNESEVRTREEKEKGGRKKREFG